MPRPKKLNESQLDEIIMKLNAGGTITSLFSEYGFSSRESFSRSLDRFGVEMKTLWVRDFKR